MNRVPRSCSKLRAKKQGGRDDAQSREQKDVGAGFARKPGVSRGTNARRPNPLERGYGHSVVGMNESSNRLKRHKK